MVVVMIEFIVALVIVALVIFAGSVIAWAARDLEQQDFNDSAHWHEWAENQSRRDDL